MAEVYVVRGGDRGLAIHQLLDRFDLSGFKGQSVAVKANYNSADPFPASTHIDTLRAIIARLLDAGAGPITLAERSGMGLTQHVLEDLGVNALARDLGFNVVVLEDLESEDWVRLEPAGTHWKRGFLFARPILEADRIVQTCCLKTHRFGGHFTMSLKNTVGLVARIDPRDGYDYMGELHTSPHQREMIAEINLAYEPDIIIMDAFKAFVTGGPEAGEEVSPNIMLASSDRVALDACGVAVLRILGSNHRVSSGRIFDQDQIRRAAELGIGVERPEDVVMVPLGEGAEEPAETIVRMLREEG